jgi:hypothetical protein
LRTSPVRLGPVRCGVNDENTSTSPGTLVWGGSLKHSPAERVDEVVPQRAMPVQAGHDLRASVLDRGRHQRQPAREILLGQDERVTVVLVPGEPAGPLHVLVHRLIPVEVGVFAHQICAHGGQDRMAGQAAEDVRLDREVLSEGNCPFLADTGATVAGGQLRLPLSSRRRSPGVLHRPN